MNVVFDNSEAVAPGIKTFWFKPERPVRYTAGQFTELYLPHQPADSRGQRRWFTLSSSPTEELLAITTKFAPTDGSSFKQQLATLQPGTPLQLADPMGDFVLPKDPSIPLLFVAAGLGITPVRSMVKWLQDTSQQRDIHLIYTATNTKELAFQPLFNDYGLQLTTIIPQDNAKRLNAARVLELAAPSSAALIYISGPEAMVETLTQDLQTKGIPPHRLIGDYYPGYLA